MRVSDLHDLLRRVNDDIEPFVLSSSGKLEDATGPLRQLEGQLKDYLAVHGDHVMIAEKDLGVTP